MLSCWFVNLSLRSRRKHKAFHPSRDARLGTPAWGVSPRMETASWLEPADRATAVTIFIWLFRMAESNGGAEAIGNQQTEILSPAPRLEPSSCIRSRGLRPGLFAVARSARYLPGWILYGYGFAGFFRISANACIREASVVLF